jgi:phosphoribosylformylglycinamidine synthase
VTGGNVSFYNESPTAAVYPTPVIGMLGVMDDIAWATPSGFSTSDDVIVLLGRTDGHVGGSEYLQAIHGLVAGDAPPIHLEGELRLQQTLLKAIREGLVRSAHDCSDGGLAVALAECCLGVRGRRIGARIAAPPDGARPDFFLFGEDQSRLVVSTSPGNANALVALFRSSDIPAERIGTVGGERLVIGELVDLSCEALARGYLEAIEKRMS